MKKTGIFFLVAGLIWMVIAINMKTTLAGAEVHNIGLLANRLNHVIASALLLLIGTILLGFGKLSVGGKGSEEIKAVPSNSIPPIAIAIGALFFAGLLGLMLFGVKRSGNPDRDSLPSALIGKPAPDFELPVLHDPTVRVHGRELRGAPYLLNVWGSWCPACRDEHPILTRFAETKRVRVIGYNWKDEPADALRWLEQLGNPYLLVLADYDGRTALDWGIAAAPETFLVDGSGIVRWKYSGAITEDVMARQLIPALEKIEHAARGAAPQAEAGSRR